MSIRRAIFRRVQTTITLTTTAALAGLTGIAGIAGLTLAPAAHADDSGVQVFAASTASSPTDPSLTAFYTPPATVPSTPGTVIRTQSFSPKSVGLLPFNGTGVRVMFSSTDALGRPIAVTGAILLPNARWWGSGARPVVAYDTGTVGMADRCAPSRGMTNGSWEEGGFASAALDRGWVVAVNDYYGLGTPGIEHAYMVRKTSAYATLDLIRAAQSLSMTGLTTTSPVGIMGYSEGGGAAAAAAELAASYAPSLNIKGVAMGAVPADLAAVAQSLDGGAYAAFLFYAVSGLATSYDVNLSTYLNTSGLSLLTQVRDSCVIDGLGLGAFKRTSNYTVNGQSASAYFAAAPWNAILADNKIGNIKPRMPVFVSHSLLDDVIPYSIGRNLGRSWCSKGANVTFRPLGMATHIGASLTSYPAQISWLNDRFNGYGTWSNCGWF